MVEVPGRAEPAEKRVRAPGASGSVTVTLTEMAAADFGIPQAPARVKSRFAPACRAGPPEGPSGLRVSTIRHGATEKYPYPRGFGVRVGGGVEVGLGVGVGVAVGGG